MPARSALVNKRYSTFSKWIKATVINDIWPELIFFTLVATMVTLVSEMTSTSLGISSQMLTVLGIVLGLVVSFRTSSAYDRYWEGRKLWTAINLASRNIAHMIWIHVPNDRLNDVASSSDSSSSSSDRERSAQEAHMKAIIEKKTMINLVQAFSVAVKHMLRGEPGIYYRDLYPLVCYLPRYASEISSTHDAHEHELPLFASSVRLRRTQTMPETTPREPVNGTGADKEGNGSNKKLSWRSKKESGTLKREDTFDPEQVLPHIEPEDAILMDARNPPSSTMYDYFPFLLLFKPFAKLFMYPVNKLRRNTNMESTHTLPHANVSAPGMSAPGMSKTISGASTSSQTPNRARSALGRRRRPAVIESNVPLEITLFLSTYLAFLQKNNLIAPSIATGLTNNISSLQDTMANLDRIRSTPIPFAYQAHLRMTMWLYLFFLPFQVYNAFEYLTIPATAFAAYLLLGFLEIGQEIEDPFGYDMNDLDLDHFCLNIERELHEITAHPAPDPETFIFSKNNQPFAPADRRSAKQLLEDGYEKVEYLHEEKGVASLRKTLLKSWKEVADKTVERK